MSARTVETTVTFARPFKLEALDELQPPGTYRVVTDEEEILGVSFLAYRRTATMLLTPAVSIHAGLHQSHVVDQADLDAALAVDGRAGDSR